MTVLMFPDNTVLINFAIINRMDLLERLANGNGRWCATVRTECAESARQPGLAALDGVAEIFGEPLYPDEAEHQDVRVLRDQLAGGPRGVADRSSFDKWLSPGPSQTRSE